MNSPVDYSRAARGDTIAVVTPDDSTTYATTPLVGVVVGTPGDLVVTNRDGVDCTIPENCLVAGVVLPLPRCIAIKATGTTADEIVGYFSDR